MPESSTFYLMSRAGSSRFRDRPESERSLAVGLHISTGSIVSLPHIPREVRRHQPDVRLGKVRFAVFDK